MAYTWLYKTKYSDRENYDKIYSQRYNSDSTYRYDFNIHSYPAFVVINTELMELISEIYKLDKQLYSVEAKLPIVALDNYKHNCLIDEIKQTNELEGVASTRKEISDILYRRSTNNDRLSGIVNKYAMLLTGDNIPLTSCRDIRDLYDDLVLNEVVQTDPENRPDGEIFRKDIVYVKNKLTGEVIHTGTHPEAQTIEYMSTLLSILNSKTGSPLINIAVVHYLFGYIHPFYDGNGRMGRFLSSYQLSKNLDQIISYRLAYAIKKDTAKYYKMFKLTNDKDNRGDMTMFTVYFMKLIRDILVSMNRKFTDYLDILVSYNDKVESIGLNDVSKHTLFVLIQNTLFENEGLSVDDLSVILQKSGTTVRKAISDLEARELVTKARTRPYRYSADLDKIS